MDCPKYEIGEELLLSHSDLPDRIIISTVYKKFWSKEWMYQVVSEQVGGYTYMSETQITRRLSLHQAKVYGDQNVIKLYNDGFLWVKNVSHKKYAKFVDNISNMKEVLNILISKVAYFPNGSIDKNKVGIWVRYRCDARIVIKDSNENNNKSG